MSEENSQELLTLKPKERPVPRTSSHALFGGRKQLLIEHDGAVYSLRVTRRGKLILTK